jgi:hypothetical protein
LLDKKTFWCLLFRSDRRTLLVRKTNIAYIEKINVRCQI